MNSVYKCTAQCAWLFRHGIISLLIKVAHMLQENFFGLVKPTKCVRILCQLFVLLIYYFVGLAAFMPPNIIEPRPGNQRHAKYKSKIIELYESCIKIINYCKFGSTIQIFLGKTNWVHFDKTCLRITLENTWKRSNDVRWSNRRLSNHKTYLIID